MLCQTASHTLPPHGQDCLCCSHTIVGDENLASKQPPQGNDSRLRVIGPYDKTMLSQVVLSPVIEAFEWTNFLHFLTTFQIQTDIGVTYSRVETVMTLEFLSKFFCNKPGTTATVCLINLTFMPSEWRAFLAALWHRSLRGWSSSQPPQSCSPSMTKCNMFSLSRLRYQK